MRGTLGNQHTVDLEIPLLNSFHSQIVERVKMNVHGKGSSISTKFYPIISAYCMHLPREELILNARIILVMYCMLPVLSISMRSHLSL